jgi:hypothetical protein
MRPIQRTRGTFRQLAVDWFREWNGSDRTFVELSILVEQGPVDSFGYTAKSAGWRIIMKPGERTPLFSGIAAQPTMEKWLVNQWEARRFETREQWVEFNLAVRERMALELLMRKHHNRRRITDAAEDLMRLQNENVIEAFRWTKTGDWHELQDVEDLLYCRHMNCFEFVFLCGWLAGPQGLNPHGPVPKVQFSGTSLGCHLVNTSQGLGYSSAGRYANKVKWSHHIIRHKVLYSSVPGGNDSSNGLFHVGLATGGGKVIHLNTVNSRIRVDSIDSLFIWQYAYGNVYESDFDFI